MRNWRNIWLGVKLGVLVGGVDVRVRTGLGLRRHITLALLKHRSGCSLVGAILLHNLLKLLVLVVHVLNLITVWRNQQPLVHVHDVNIHQGILLLKTLGVRCSLITGRKASANLHAQLLILLRLIWTNEGNASKVLPWDSQIILLERTHLK